MQEAENAIGVEFGMPETIEGSYIAESFRTLEAETPIIEVTYIDSDWTVVVRKAPGEGRDISEIYDYDTIEISEDQGNGKPIVYYRNKDTKSEKWSLKILVDHDGYSWSVYAPNGFWGDSGDGFLIAIFE